MAYVTLRDTAHVVPETVVTNDDLAKLMPTSDDWIQSHTGIKTRHVAINENTSQLAAKVGQKLLSQTHVAPTDIDLIIVSTITPDSLTPSTACLVQAALGATNAFAFDISAACAGFIFGLTTAAQFLRSGQYRRALVISAETNTKMMDWQDRTTTVFFGDGAGGALLEATNDPTQESFIAAKLATDGAQHETIESGKIAPLATATDAHHQPSLTPFTMQGRDVFTFATEVVPPHMQALLAANQLTAADIDLYVCHQANLRIIEKIAATLHQPMSKFATNVTTYGNTSSAGIPMALDQALAHQFTRQRKVMLTGFGAGLAYGSVILTL